MTEWSDQASHYLDGYRRRFQEPLWVSQGVRATLHEHLAELVSAQVGIAQYQEYLRGCVEQFEALQRAMESAATQAEQARQRSDAEGKVPPPDSPELNAWNFDTTVRHWYTALHQEALKNAFEDQCPHVRNIIRLIHDDFLRPWEQLNGLFQRLELETEGDEVTYYRTRSTRVPACPTQHFINLIAPSRHNIVQHILQELATALDSWNEQGVIDPSQRFFKLCAAKAMEHSGLQPYMNCERLFSGWYRGEEFNRRLSLLARQATAFWQMEDSYPLADNKKEIAGAGVVNESPFYLQLRSGNRELQAVNEQRADLIPLFRTEHGMSLVGLRPLSSYRRTFINAIFQEQRWDFHFFLDRRWVAEFEFPDEEEGWLRPLQIFSIANMLGYIFRGDKNEYRLRRDRTLDHSDVLEHSRHLAFRTLCAQHEDLTALERMIEEQKDNGALEAQRLEDWMRTLHQRMRDVLERTELNGRRADIDKVTKQDVFQVHCELRALRAFMPVTEEGI